MGSDARTVSNTLLVLGSSDPYLVGQWHAAFPTDGHVHETRCGWNRCHI